MEDGRAADREFITIQGPAAGLPPALLLLLFDSSKQIPHDHFSFHTSSYNESFFSCRPVTADHRNSSAILPALTAAFARPSSTPDPAPSARSGVLSS